MSRHKPARRGTEAAAPARTAAPATGVAPAGSGAATRRGLLSRLAVALGALATAELAWIVASFLKPRGRAAAPADWLVTAGAAADFAPGSVTAFPQGRFYLVRLPEGGFLAIHATCTHLGCTVPWDQQARRFACPCHASVFDIRGDVLGPPAPRALDLFQVRIENDIIRVDTRRPRRRSRFEPSQAVTS
jgi:cytochrome b6-f complex iron-sulfur subunit